MVTPATTAPMHRVPAGIRVKMRIPATSANLGPGFDAAGLALSLYDDVEIVTTQAGFSAEIIGEGADYLPTDARHLIISQLRALLQRMGWVVPGLKLTAINRIPHSRGLGSSAAAHVAAVLGALSLLPPDDFPGQQALLQHSAALEGHPDNVAPAIFGALTLSWTQHGAENSAQDSDDGAPAQFFTTRVPVHPAITPVVAVPNNPLSTAAARGLLPELVPHQDAAANAARAALLQQALSMDPALLLPATMDTLHQDYRAPGMPETVKFMHQLRAQGLAAVVSGAGPTLMVLAQSRDEARQAKHQILELIEKSPQRWDVQILPVDDEGANVEVFRP